MAATNEVAESPALETLAEALVHAVSTEANWDLVGSQGSAPATYSGGPLARGFSFSTLDDRADGRQRPFFSDEHDLARQRAMARNLAAFTSVAVGAGQALQVYTMGGEWQFEMQPRNGQEDSTPPELVAALQEIVDDTLERNDWVGDLDRELHDVSREDGETLVALYPTSDGRTDIRRLEVDSLREPSNPTQLHRWLDMPVRTPQGRPYADWSYGVLTHHDPRIGRIDHERHAGYHVVHDDGGVDWDFLPATPQLHLGDGKCGHLIRRNVHRSTKRGVSDYWSVQVDLEREDKLNENISVGAAVQAAIAYFRQHPKGTTSSSASEQINSALETYARVAHGGGSITRKLSVTRPGTAIDLPAGKEYKPNPFGAGHRSYIDVGASLKRRIGIRWLFPEYMISGDASNANFASTLVAESPFVKAREGDQGQYVKHFKTILWRAVRIAYLYGRLKQFGLSWPELIRRIELLITPPPVATRDKMQQVQELTALFDRGIVDANEVRIETRREERPELEGRTGRGAANLTDQAAQQDTPAAAAVDRALGSVTSTTEARAILRTL